MCHAAGAIAGLAWLTLSHATCSKHYVVSEGLESLEFLKPLVESAADLAPESETQPKAKRQR